MDALGRTVDYLRISITDRCNERCLYCMPEGFNAWKQSDEILTYEEILRVAKVATELGFRKFRVTGGEPLVRKDVVPFIRSLAAFPQTQSLGMTTNATRLAPIASELRQAGLKTLNISLDALTPSVYQAITHGKLEPVLDGIKAAIAAGFESIKLNMVLIRGINDHEIWPLIRFAAEHHLVLRFIELMPVSLTEMLNETNFLPVSEVMQRISKDEELLPVETTLGHGPARYYKLARTGSTVGFIGAITQLHFCDACNKIRLTADGKIRPCLGNHGEYDLKATLRSKAGDEAIRKIFRLALGEKPPEHLFRDNYKPDRVMTAIGG